MLGNEIQWNDGKVCHEHLVAAARATARAAAASSSFLRFFSSANSFSAAARASCSAFRRFSSCPTVCLSFCFACTALWSLKTQTRVYINTGTVHRLLCTFLKGSYDVAKNSIIWCIWCNAMFTQFKVQKILFSTFCTLLLLLYAQPFWNAPIFT